ncbi:hypothetical protein LEP1GSC137_1025 [Leptospira borgpetersenii str. Noumea 25]|uniref:Uncharacterized protein n=1 Tax=Leptospira borgpetersenii str. 200701203 TaxID=1193007 RepID=M3F9M4_LEPBO|nr:hypothetical protein LEP1GSC123_1909 [Leptospira borgpetersenii str. 200701203]EMO07628.1 hypothetical protein LEP1GSC137_1025 [Leptospira borgpetersenii str. Noumea 25]
MLILYPKNRKSFRETEYYNKNLSQNLGTVRTPTRVHEQ